MPLNTVRIDEAIEMYNKENKRIIQKHQKKLSNDVFEALFSIFKQIHEDNLGYSDCNELTEKKAKEIYQKYERGISKFVNSDILDELQENLEFFRKELSKFWDNENLSE
jgi:uncharacterized membrane-anchored protein YjiN (DUF445 family)